MKTTRTNPWHVRSVRSHSGGHWIYVQGYNRYTGAGFCWRLDWHSFKDPGFTSRRYTFHGATWHTGSREAFNRIVATAKRLRGSV